MSRKLIERLGKFVERRRDSLYARGEDRLFLLQQSWGGDDAHTRVSVGLSEAQPTEMIYAPGRRLDVVFHGASIRGLGGILCV